MPRSGLQTSDSLGIEIENFQASYAPGDTIIGRVTRNESLNVAAAGVAIKLFGRAKTKITRSGTESKSNYRGRAVFLEVQEVLHRGKILSADGIRHSWPFSITIPTASQPGFESPGGEWSEEEDFLGSYKVDVTKHQLPSAFYFTGSDWFTGTKVESFVEYVLKAQIDNSDSDKAGRVLAETTMPLFVSRPSTEFPIETHKIWIVAFEHQVKSLRLLPAHADKKLTMRQRSRMLFQPSTTPKYGFSVELEYPNTIQLSHPKPAPLTIHIKPNRVRTSHEFCSDTSARTIDALTLPPVKLVALKLELRATVKSRAHSTFGTTNTTKHRDYDITYYEPFPSPVIPAIQTGGKAINGPTPLDLGSLIMHSYGASALNTNPVRFETPVYPTFSTYNINLSYEFRWTVVIECAGERENFHADTPVTILAPSAEQERHRLEGMNVEEAKASYEKWLEAVSLGLTGADLVLQLIEVVGQA
jgi:hypothetical protein